MTKQQPEVAIYARYSTDRQDSRSIEDQGRRCRVFAHERGYKVVAEFKDAAQSGANVHRADLQRLLADVRKGRGSAFSAVLVDDLSRLSRDAGDTWSIVFEHLASADVRVIDCSTGMASDGAGARLTFGAMALVNDTFLQMVRSETHRGLQGRAAKGFHPGGRCYGYETRPEATPEDAEHPRAEVFINKEEAKVVQRIFTEASQGAGLGTIAGGLNRDGIPAAYDRLGYAKLATGKGWGINQIHYLLRNERYIGKQSWNKRRWFRDPLTKKRRFKLRPEEQWVINDRPDLAIIDAYLWTRVQGRFSKTAGRKRGRPPGSTTVVKYAHLLTGLLRCGVCGGSMTIVGGKQKGTLSYPNFGCSTNHNKGDLACRNRKRVGENLINETVFRAVVEFVSSDEFRTWAADMSRRQQAARRKNQPDEVAALEAAFRSQQATVERVASRYLEADFSDMLKMMLKKEEEKLRGLRGRLALLAQAPKTASTPAVHIDVEQVIETLRDLQQMSKKRPLEARRALHEAIEKVVLVVRKNAAGDDAYEAEVTLRNASATSDGGRVGAKISCGDRI